MCAQNYGGEEVWLSGAVPLEPQSWELYRRQLGAWKTKLPPQSRSANGGYKAWGLHELHDPADRSLWQVVKTLARYPNAGSRDARENHWATIGLNASWLSRQPVGDRGHQIVVNATAAVPKTVTNFPDYYVYGVGGNCATQGYDPPGGWMCSIYGSMHGGTFDSATAKWEGGGYPNVFPGALSLSNTTGAVQSVFPHSSSWMVSNTSGAAGIIRAWVNGWFVSMWEIADWVSQAVSTLTSQFCFVFIRRAATPPSFLLLPTHMRASPSNEQQRILIHAPHRMKRALC